jgi:hypothetical protein
MRACLNCHALPEAGEVVADRLQLSEGVTCHGPYFELKRRPGVTIDRDRARALLHEACKIEKTTVLDYDSARQRAWAIRAICQDLVAEDPKDGPDQAFVDSRAPRSLKPHAGSDIHEQSRKSGCASWTQSR